MTRSSLWKPVHLFSIVVGWLLMSAIFGCSDDGKSGENGDGDTDSTSADDDTTPGDSSSDSLSDSDAAGGCLKLIDRVDAAAPDGTHEFREEPMGNSVVQTLLGEEARVLPPAMDMAGYVAFKMGKDKGLIAGKSYLLTIDYPDDAPRTTVVVNRGSDQIRTFSTGAAIGDYREQYAYPNPESMQYPHSNQWKQAKFFFHLHERFQDLEAHRNTEDTRRPNTPDDGFWVAIGQFNQLGNPREDGAAVAAISLYEVQNEEEAFLHINLPPQDLPRRHVFWREEMNDTTSFCSTEDRAVDPTNPAFTTVCNPATADYLTWFDHKMKLSKALGFNTYATDLLEFGHNQGWDAAPFGGQYFFHNPSTTYWNEVVAMANDNGLEVLPMYEYYGSLGAATFTDTLCSVPDDNVGHQECQAAHGVHYKCLDRWAAGAATPTCAIPSLGYQRRCRPLTDRDPLYYTGVWWAENRCLDITDPDAIADVHTLLDATVLAQIDLANFVGVWFRARVSSWPISFSDQTLERFSVVYAATVTRQLLIDDTDVRQQYYDWWFDKRHEYLTSIRDYMQSNGLPDGRLLFTPYHAEGYPSASKSGVVTDDNAGWDATNQEENWQWRFNGEDWQTWVDDGIFEDSITKLVTPTAEELAALSSESQHGTPVADPESYAATADINLTVPFGRLYTVAEPALFERFRTPSGLALIRHYPLNEGDGSGDITVDVAEGSYNNWPMSGHFGYFVTDVDRAGAHSMLAETRAVANGDPNWIGYLSSGIYNSLFPVYKRRFNAAYLALPGLPSTVLVDAASDDQVVVRSIDGGTHGTYIAIANTSMDTVQDVIITLPAGETIYNLVSGEAWTGEAITMYSGELISLRMGGDLPAPSATGANGNSCFAP